MISVFLVTKGIFFNNITLGAFMLCRVAYAVVYRPAQRLR
jgi:hypothetical protein